MTSPFDVLPSFDGSGAASKTPPPCGGDLIASFEAKSIPFPRANETWRQVFCEWKIRAPHPFLTIGIAFVDIDIMYRGFESNDYLIDIHDGPNAEHIRTLYWHGFHDFQLLLPFQSSADSVFVNITAFHAEPTLNAKLLYFLCGGTVANDMKISSPMFSPSYANDILSSHMQCTWNLVKPKNARYGFLHMHNLNVRKCGVLSLTAYGGALLVGENATNDENNTIVTTTPPSTKNVTRIDNTTMGGIYQLTDINNETFVQGNNRTHVHRIDICQHSQIAWMGFNGSRAELKFSLNIFSNLSGSFGIPSFNAAFIAVRKVPEMKKAPPPPWYLNYAPVVIYLPLGVILGVVIMLIQGRRRGPSEVRLNRVNATNGNCLSLSESSTADAHCVCVVEVPPKSIMRHSRRRREDDPGPDRNPPSKQHPEIPDANPTELSSLAGLNNNNIYTMEHSDQDEMLEQSTSNVTCYQLRNSTLVNISRTDSDTPLLKEGTGKRVTFHED
ncbi:unnamed protein product [Clavelina lepadiformis]